MISAICPEDESIVVANRHHQTRSYLTQSINIFWLNSHKERHVT